jgi:hypothetical protein
VLAMFFSPPFRLMITHIYIFGEWSSAFLILPIVLTSVLTTALLAKFIEARANNKVKE